MSSEKKEIYCIAKNNGHSAVPAESMDVSVGATTVLSNTLNNTKSTAAAKEAEEPRISTTITYMNVLLSIVECTLFSGIQFGWSSLVFVYKEIGLYRNLCPGNRTREPSDACPDQEEYLNMFFSVSCVVLFTLSIVAGTLHRRLGTTKTRLVFICIYPCGLLLMSFTSTDIPWLFFPGLTLVGVSGLVLIITDMHVISYIRKGKGFFVTVLNGAFDSSAVAFLIVKVLYQRGMELKHIFWGIAAVQIVATLTNTFLHWKQTEVYSERTTAEPDKTDDNFENEMQTNDKDPTFGESVCTIRFFLYLIWILVLCLRWMAYIGLVNRQFSVVLETDSMVSEFTNILSYFLFGGFIISIVTGGILVFLKKLFEGNSDFYSRKVYPMVIALSTCSAMSIIISTLGIVQSANTFYAEFAVIPFYRSMLFATNMNYVVTMFHRKWISTIMAISYTMNGIATVAQYFIFEWVMEYNAFQQMNFMLLGSSLVSFALPIMLLLKRERWTSPDVVVVHIHHSQTHPEQEPETS